MGALPWMPWLDLSPLQYRPLTFNLWLVLAHASAATPWLMHLVFVALGTANAWLLARVLAGATRRRAPLRGRGRLRAFAVVVYVHGWTATLADLLTLASRSSPRARSSTRRQPKAPRLAIRAFGAALLVALALLCKESAIVLPALLVLAAYGQPSSQKDALAVVFSATVVIAYLALRLPILLDGARQPRLCMVAAKHRSALTEYCCIHSRRRSSRSRRYSKRAPRDSSPRRFASRCCSYALATRNWRWPAVWLAAFICALAPVLVLPIAYDHYAYLASAATIAIAAAAWPILRRAAHALSRSSPPSPRPRRRRDVAHGRAGVVERNLHADLLEVVQLDPARRSSSTAADPRDAWLLERLLHDVDRYRGVSLLNVRSAAERGRAPRRAPAG